MEMYCITEIKITKEQNAKSGKGEIWDEGRVVNGEKKGGKNGTSTRATYQIGIRGGNQRSSTH
jgi:hypothetical protein